MNKIDERALKIIEDQFSYENRAGSYLTYRDIIEAYEAAKGAEQPVELPQDAIERKHAIFEEWALLTPHLPIARDGDGEYESEATRAYWMCGEFMFNRGVQIGVFHDAATKINGELCDRVAELEKQIEAPMREISEEEMAEYIFNGRHKPTDVIKNPWKHQLGFHGVDAAKRADKYRDVARLAIEAFKRFGT